MRVTRKLVVLVQHYYYSPLHQYYQSLKCMYFKNVYFYSIGTTASPSLLFMTSHALHCDAFLAQLLQCSPVHSCISSTLGLNTLSLGCVTASVEAVLICSPPITRTVRNMPSNG